MGIDAFPARLRILIVIPLALILKELFLFRLIYPRNEMPENPSAFQIQASISSKQCSRVVYESSATGGVEPSFGWSTPTAEKNLKGGNNSAYNFLFCSN